MTLIYSAINNLLYTYIRNVSITSSSYLIISITMYISLVIKDIPN